MKGKKISIDAYNTIYQFLAAIRQPDGTPLIDSKGRITSHLNGLFYRTISIIESGIIPIFVFDGKPPEKKSEEIERRKRAKEEAEKKLEKAKLEGEYREIRKYAQAAVRLSNEMVEESKKLLDAMGIPVVQAPGEGEAEAAYINSIDLSWAAASQDYDSLLFGAKRLVRNITISGKRKLPNKDVYVEIKPELIELESLLKKLGINREQLIDIAILIGTDYNPDGVKGIGVKTALRIIKKYNNIENAIEKGEIQLSKINFDIREIRKLFITPEVKKPTERLELAECNEREIIELLVKNHDFNEDRVNNGIERLKKAIKEAKSVEKQTGLDQWF
ncbi:XPG/RAD25 related endonuclease [Sulfolobus acidocaldarius DSM 639]|uniref:Flap endonuclease 1 n=3 Tax=Sulfolobus acidocaldarius TaxID=2285 RepID=M1J122_9CREN|nr:XPG/RAD25 related endonuclease [Sulfolobus acidocaldarius DSM 639]AGE70724.1 flap endonuclease-1 [Sulfolobus acidocaldarius N8]AGE72996.1 flap endonuclease-1 [Sulfolobus acidocaldarius Ron12/I]